MSEVKETARPQFYIEPVQDKARSAAEGRPIFVPKRFVKLTHPGDKSWSYICEIDENGLEVVPVDPSDPSQFLKRVDYAERFPREFSAFKKGEERASVGTPLDEWGTITRSRAAELKAMNIFTVEEYANVSDSALSRLGMHSREEREKARAFIATSKGTADVSAMAAQIAQLQAMVEQLQAGGAVAQAPSQVDANAPQNEKAPEDCTDDELKAYIKRETGEGVRGQPSRDTLLKRVMEIAAQKAA